MVEDDGKIAAAFWADDHPLAHPGAAPPAGWEEDASVDGDLGGRDLEGIARVSDGFQRGVVRRILAAFYMPHHGG